MSYVHIPVEWDEPTEDDYHSFHEAMKEIEPRTIHVHCAANMRVSAFLYRYWRNELGLPDEEARVVMDGIWQPGGKWATLLGDEAATQRDHRHAGRDY